MNCPICESQSVNKKYTLFDDRYAYPGDFNLFECKGCQHKFLDVEFSPEQLSELYSKYYPRSTFEIESYKAHEELNSFSVWMNGNKASTYRWVPKNVRVLDIGCGFGESLGYHQKRECEVWGVEADENISRVADRFGFNVKVGLFDPKEYQKEYFDYITMDQVIEHISNPIEILTGMESILKPDGYIVLSTPNSNGFGARLFKRRWINWHTPYHLQFFSKRSIEVIADKVGLEIKMIKTITNSRWINYQWIHGIFFPKQGEKSSFWSSTSKNISLFEKLVFKLFSIFHKIGVDHLLTRLFDSLGHGDNFIIILRKKVMNKKDIL